MSEGRKSNGDTSAVPLLVGVLPPPISGQSVCFEMLLRGLAQRRIPHDFIDLSESKYQRPIGKTFSLKRAVQMSFIVLRFAVRAVGKPRVVYLTIAQSWMGFIRDFCMMWWASLWRHRIVIHLKGGGFGRFYMSLPRWQKWLVRNTWRRATTIIVLGESLRRMVDFDSALSSRVKVISNPLPEGDDGLPVNGKTLPANRPIRVLYLSNLLPSKGYLLLLEAIRILVKERGHFVEAHFCGEFVPENSGDFAEGAERMKKEFEELVDAGGLSSNVYYHGTVRGESKRALLTQSDFFVLPTQYSSEGQPISIIEAMAYGLVVLATPIASIPDLIDDRASGILISPQPEAIAGALEQMLKHPADFQTISSGAIQKYRRSHTPEAHLNAIISCLLGREDISHRA